MKYLYVKPVFQWFSAIAVMFLGACTSEVPGTLETAEAISFGVPQTRAAVETANDMDAFSVWGWYKDTETSGDPVSVFDETRVDQASGWNYEGGTRYWIPGKTYSFYGVYPHGLENVEVTSDGITITNFDCSATGENAVDLMTAVNTGLLGADAPMVNMSFSHELVRINFIVRTEEGGMAYLTKSELDGVVCQGTLTRNFSNTDTRTWQLSEQRKVFQKQYNPAVEIDIKGETLMDEMLLPPQTIATETASISITYSYGYGEAQSQTVSIPAITWEAGKSYTYTLTIASDGRIHFASPVIDKWGEALGGIIIVA